MFDKILIANRGEIACRIIETAQSLGIRTVAVYSDADVTAKHVALADEAYYLGPPPARESYLLGDRIVEVAQESGAQAIHPGYGFLSENAGFAEACATAGIVFIGPPADAIRAMGSKSQAKAVMGEAGVPLVPGYHGDDQDPAFLEAEAGKVGFPLLIKASAGGGGKGMRLVEKAADFASALEGCKREAAAAFGDDHVLLERFVTRPRHIEMQVFADAHGNAVHLFERDCSVQRRHQKVLEEAPAPGMTEALRNRMGEAATAAARAIGYRGAGTVEFIVETGKGGAPGDFFFMEMNTRLQVEHPVTEMVTGQDLVAWQLKVAAGAELPLTQDRLILSGHAVEARLYAEDPENAFLPATGRLHHLHLPEAEARVDSGVRQGDDVSVYYDPMIAKIITYGADRAEALRRLGRALARTRAAGVVTNRDFLAHVAGHRAFAAAQLDTGFIDRHERDLIPDTTQAPDHVLAFATLALLEARRQRSGEDRRSPWATIYNWRINDSSHTEFLFERAGRRITVQAEIERDRYLLSVDGRVVGMSDVTTAGTTITAMVDGEKESRTVVLAGEQVTVISDRDSYRLTRVDPMARAGVEEGGADRLTAPMPGKVTAVYVKEGDAVTEGQALMVLEAMKMEHTIAAPADGLVASVRFAAGEQVSDGDVLIAFAEEAAS